MEDLINLNDVHVEQTSSTNISGESIDLLRIMIWSKIRLLIITRIMLR